MECQCVKLWRQQALKLLLLLLLLLYIYYVVIGGCFALTDKYMVKHIKQKQQQKQQLQSLLPPELDTLTLHEGGVPIIKGGVPLLRVRE